MGNIVSANIVRELLVWSATPLISKMRTHCKAQPLNEVFRFMSIRLASKEDIPITSRRNLTSSCANDKAITD